MESFIDGNHNQFPTLRAAQKPVTAAG